MTLDEAIEHCKEKSKRACECAKEHEQLSQWLIDYKELKERETPKKVKFETFTNHECYEDMTGYEDVEPRCPVCGEEVLSVANYCYSCGQALNRRVEDD